MTVPSSTLSRAAVALRTRLAKYKPLEEADVRIGHPSTFKPEAGAAALSMFFFQLVPAGNSGSAGPDHPLDTIAHVLFMPVSMTAEPAAGADHVDYGETDLAILGHVMRCFHEHPILQIRDNHEIDCEIEITPHSLTPDELNKIVPTAPEGGFRAAVAYQLALLPLPLNKPPREGPEVQVVTYGVTTEPALVSGDFPQQEVGAIVPSTTTLKGPQLYLMDEKKPCVFLRRSASAASQLRLRAVGSNSPQIEVTIRRWVPADLDYLPVKTLQLTPGEAYAWEPPKEEFTAQYVLEAEEGGLCVLVVLAEEGV